MSNVKSGTNTVLLVDDQIGDLRWLTDRIESEGYAFVCATDEEEAQERLRAVARGEESYLFAVIDVMMATHNIRRVQAIDQKFFQSSKDSGIRLCRFAREIGISAAALPIAVFTARMDDEVKRALASISGIELFFRDGNEGEGSLEQYVSDRLARAKTAHHKQGGKP